MNVQTAPPLQKVGIAMLYVKSGIRIWREVEQGPHKVTIYIYSRPTKQWKVTLNFITAIVVKISGHLCWINHLYDEVETTMAFSILNL